MKLNFAQALLLPDGTPNLDPAGNPTLMSKVLTNALQMLTEGIEPLKALDWMVKLQKGEPLDLDRADQEKLKKLISDGFKGMSMLVRGRLLEVFDAKPTLAEGSN